MKNSIALLLIISVVSSAFAISGESYYIATPGLVEIESVDIYNQNIVLPGPDGPIDWNKQGWHIPQNFSKILKTYPPVTDEDIQKTLDLVDKSGRSIFIVDILEFTITYKMFFWALEHAYDPHINLTSTARDQLAFFAAEIMTFIDADVAARNSDEQSFELWWYFLAKLLVLEHSFLQNETQNDLIKNQQEFLQRLYRQIPSIVSPHFQVGLGKENPKHFFEKRLFELARLQKSLSQQISILLAEWDSIINDPLSLFSFAPPLPSSELDNSIVSDEQLLNESPIKYIVPLDTHLFSKKLTEVKGFLTPRNATTRQAWEHPLTHVQHIVGQSKTVSFYSQYAELENKRHIPNNKKEFQLAFYEAMARMGYTEILLADNCILRFFQSIHLRSENAVSFDDIAADLEQFINDTRMDIPLLPYLGIAQFDDSERETVDLICDFIMQLKQLKNLYNLHIKIAHDQQKDTINDWLESTYGSLRLIVGINAFAIKIITAKTYRDAIKHLLKSSDLDADQISSLRDTKEKLQYQIEITIEHETAREYPIFDALCDLIPMGTYELAQKTLAWGDYLSVGIPFKDNEPLVELLGGPLANPDFMVVTYDGPGDSDDDDDENDGHEPDEPIGYADRDARQEQPSNIVTSNFNSTTDRRTARQLLQAK